MIQERLPRHIDLALPDPAADGEIYAKAHGQAGAAPGVALISYSASLGMAGTFCSGPMAE